MTTVICIDEVTAALLPVLTCDVAKLNCKHWDDSRGPMPDGFYHDWEEEGYVVPQFTITQCDDCDEVKVCQKLYDGAGDWVLALCKECGKPAPPPICECVPNRSDEEPF